MTNREPGGLDAILGSFAGQVIPGGCEDCDAVWEEADLPGLWHLTVHCPRGSRFAASRATGDRTGHAAGRNGPGRANRSDPWRWLRRGAHSHHPRTTSGGRHA